MNTTRKPLLVAGAVVAAMLAAGPTCLEAQTLVNGGFETPLFPEGGWSYGPTNAIWTFTNGGGIANGSALEWCVAGGYVGNQVAFLQGGGTISQPIAFPASGVYQLTYLHSGRCAGEGGFAGNQHYAVLVDGTVLAPDLKTTSNQPFTPVSLAFYSSSGTSTLTFQGTAAGDNTAFLDEVAIALVSTNAAPPCADCGTSVGGTISGNATWTKDGSPYCVTNDVYIAGNLIIREGVEVRFCSNYVFEVGGKIRVVGTDAAPVVFQPGDTNVGWQGLLFRDAVPGSYFVNAVIQGSKNSGLRITNTPPALTNCWIINNSTEGQGGGINADIRTGTEFALTGCVISNNTAKSYGGGFQLRIVGSRLVAEQCDFVQNAAGVYGGGFMAWAEAASLRLASCSSISNVATHVGGDSGYCGIGVGRLNDSNPTFDLELLNCKVIGNTARSAGGGSWAYGAGIGINSGTSCLKNCWIVGNAARNGVVKGGGIYLGTPAKATIENCVIAQNQIVGSSRGAAGIDGWKAVNVQLLNCTLFGNGTENGAVTLYVPDGGTAITNSVLWGGSGSGSVFSGSNFSVGYSCVQGGWAGIGNITANPALCSDNYSLLSLSPCIDAGNPALEYRDGCIDNRGDCSPFARGTSQNDMGAYGGPGVCGWTDPSPEPKIRIQPEGSVVLEGDPAAMGVIATGETPLTNRWYKGTAMFPGEKGAALRFSHVQLSDSSIGTDQTNAYWVEVSNARGTVASEPVWLMVSELGVTASLEQAKVWLTIRRNKPVANCDIRAADSPLGPWTNIATVALPGSTTRWQVPDGPGNGPRFYFAVPAN